MSKAEVEKFVTLFRAWLRNADDQNAADQFFTFMTEYEQPLINALRFYACDK